VFVLWGVNNPFQPDMSGFVGELPLLIAGVGLLFLLLGGGRWSVDGALRKRRRLKKEAAA
ncbi:MAG: DoxX family protein, partial [Propionibacterium sp.]|nr:DoxX family protein [Propionibacterium sp.]